MNAPLHREFRLSTRTGEGVRCEDGGVFIGRVPLLARASNAWVPRASSVLSEELSALYGLPIDASVKLNGLKSIAKALNAGEFARAQIATMFLHFPDPPFLAKSAPSQVEILKLASALDWAGLLKAGWDPAKHPRYPARASGGRGGQFAPKDADLAAEDGRDFDPADQAGALDDPRRELPRRSAIAALEGEAKDVAVADSARIAERRAAAAATRQAIADIADKELRVELRRAARKAFREAAMEALKNAGKKLVLSEIPIIGFVADIATVYDVYRFARDMIELRQAITAATKFANEGVHTLAQLRMSPVSEKFKDMRAFIKVFPFQSILISLEKKFGPAGDGMEYHHLIERNSRDVGDVAEDSDDIVRIPTIFHEAVTAAYRRNRPELGERSLREWLRTQPISVRREWGKKVLRELGLIVD